MNISQALAKITGASALIIYRGGDGREVKTEKKKKEKKRKEKKRKEKKACHSSNIIISLHDLLDPGQGKIKGLELGGLHRLRGHRQCEKVKQCLEIGPQNPSDSPNLIDLVLPKALEHGILVLLRLHQSLLVRGLVSMMLLLLLLLLLVLLLLVLLVLLHMLVSSSSHWHSAMADSPLSPSSSRRSRRRGH